MSPCQQTLLWKALECTKVLEKRPRLHLLPGGSPNPARFSEQGGLGNRSAWQPSDGGGGHGEATF